MRSSLAKQLIADGRLDAEIARRQKLREQAAAKREQSEYGWYDSAGVRQGGLIAFVRFFWPVLEPATPFVDGWPLWSMCEHLEAVTAGKITRLLMNVPPGFMKSMLVDVFWPAWEWGPMNRPHERYLAFSYSASLTIRDNRRFRDLVSCEEFHELYGDRVTLRNDAVNFVHNEATGWKIASSCGGTATGHRASRVLLNDPHSVSEAESEAVRGETVRWFREAMSNRLQDLDRDAIVVIMQRVNEFDVSGVIMSEELGYENVMIPMNFEWDRATLPDGEPARTSIGWFDPRYNEGDADPDRCDGLLAWPARFSSDACDKMKRQLGDYGWAAQYQQSPSPRGGGIFKVEWWQPWQIPPDGKFPPFDYVVGSLDGAFTSDEMNCPSAMTVWGTFVDENRRRRILLVDAWRKFLKFSGPRVDRFRVPTVVDGKMHPADFIAPGTPPNVADLLNKFYRARCMATWGLIEHVADSCRRRGVHTLLIEAKASGISAAQELRNRYGNETWSVQLVQVRGDKVARAYAAVPTWSQGMIFAALSRDGHELGWSRMVIDEMANFPTGRYSDLTDSATQAIAHLRAIGLAQSDDEMDADEVAATTPRRNMRPIYPV